MCIYMCAWCVRAYVRACACAHVRVCIGERWSEISINNTYHCIKHVEAKIISM